VTLTESKPMASEEYESGTRMFFSHSHREDEEGSRVRTYRGWRTGLAGRSNNPLQRTVRFAARR
jgi:hypothetical protein